MAGTPNYPKDLASEWNQLKRDVKSAFTSANLRVGMAKIGARVIEITGELMMNAGAKLIAKYDNGQDAFIVGHVADQVDQPLYGVQARRRSGQIAFEVFSGPTRPGFMAFYDQSGNRIFGDDENTKQGLAKPWLPYTCVQTDEFILPPKTVTSSSYTPCWTFGGLKQHPRIFGSVRIVCQGTDVARVRLFDPTTGIVIWESDNISGQPTIDLVGNHPDYENNVDTSFKYDLEIRRVSGTGAGVGVVPIKMYGIGS